MKAAALFVLSILAMVPASAQTIVGQIERVYGSSSPRTELRYRCIAYGSSGALKVDILINSATNALEVELDNDVRVRGIASETLDRKSGTTYYFLQGGSAPLLQRLTLAIRDGGKWARFTKAYGADEFVCE